MLQRVPWKTLAGAVVLSAALGCGGDAGTSGTPPDVNLGTTAAQGPMWLRIYSESSSSGYRDTDGVYVTRTGFVALSGEAGNLDATMRVDWTNQTTGASGSGRVHFWAVGPLEPGWVQWDATIPVAAGENRIVVHGADDGGRSASEATTIRRRFTVQITMPTTAATAITPASIQAIGGSVPADAGVTEVTWLNETTQQTGAAAGTTDWSASVSLALGSNSVVVTARSPGGPTSEARIDLTYDPAAPPLDTFPPVLTAWPPSTWSRTGPSVQLSGTVIDDVGPAWVSWKNETTGVTGTAWGTSPWTAWIVLAPGGNRITLTARDNSQKTVSQTIDVTYPFSWPP